MISSDVFDMGVVLQLKCFVFLLCIEFDVLVDVLCELVWVYKGIEMIGCFYVIYGELIIFGFKVVGWFVEIECNWLCLKCFEQDVVVG